MQIERFERFFDPDRILLLTSEELRSHPDTSVDRILAFLGVEPALLPRGARFEVHQTAAKRVRTSLPYPALGRLRFRDRLPDTLFRRVRDRVTAPLPDQLADLPVEVDRRVRDWLAPDVEAIASRLPGDFDGWGLL